MFVLAWRSSPTRIHGGLRHAVATLRRSESRFRMSSGGLRHAEATLQRGEGGESEIRTHGTFNSTTVFKTVALNHSAISPI